MNIPKAYYSCEGDCDNALHDCCFPPDELYWHPEEGWLCGVCFDLEETPPLELRTLAAYLDQQGESR